MAKTQKGFRGTWKANDEPYVDDYVENFQYVLDGFCDMHGLKLAGFESDCSQTDFEPDFYPLPW